MTSLKASVLSEPILVGRERELKELQHCLDLAVRGKGTTVFISGEAGSGKTKLIREFLSRAKEQGITALTGWCLSNAAVPYFPFFEAFNVYFSDKQIRENESDEDVTEWLKGPSQTGKPGIEQAISPQVWKDQTFAAVTKTLLAISAKKPVILFIDDVHWADSASLALIHYIARAISSEKVLLLVTFRSEQLTPDAEGRPHPLVETLRLMRREDLFKEIKIPALDPKDISEVAKSMLGGLPQPELGERLAEESQGNPLFVVESLRMLNETGGLVLFNDQWRLSVDELGIPPKIRDIVLQRAGLLLRSQRRVLEAASVIGEGFNVGILGSVLGLGSFELIETLDAIAKATSFVYCVGDLYWFDHSRSREAIYEEISPALKREYHAKVAETLEDTFKGSKLPLGEVAYHFAQAGNSDKAIEYALAAGHDALARWSNTEAVQHFDYVLKAVGDNPEHAEQRLSALEGLGDAFFTSCMFKEAGTIFEDLANISETGSVKLRALRKAIKSEHLFVGCTPHFRKLVEEAEQCAASDRLEGARFLMLKGLARMGFMSRSIDETIKDFVVALRIFEEEYSLWDTAEALHILGVQRARLGMTQEGLAESLRSISLYEELGDFRSQMKACFVAGLTLNNCMLSTEAFEMFAKVIEIDEAMKTRNYMQLTNANAFSSVLLANTGDFEKALAYSLKALEFSEKTDSAVAHGTVYSTLTMQYTRLGDLKNAEKYHKKLMKLPQETRHHILVPSAIANAVFFAGRNQWEESNRTFNEYFNWIKSNPSPPVLATAREIYAWALERQGRFEEAKVQLEESREIHRGGETMFEHTDLRAHLMVRRQAVVGEEFEMRLDLVNVSRKPGLLIEVQGLAPIGFEVKALLGDITVENHSIKMKKRKIDPFRVETIKLKLKASKPGTYTLNPEVTYLGEMNQIQTCKANSIAITAQSAKPRFEVLPGRISTGTEEIDTLLFGGIPEGYAVVLTAPPSDERDYLIRNFLEAGVKEEQTSFYVTTEAVGIESLLEKPGFYLFLCNPKPKIDVQDLPNVFKLRSKTDINNLNMALARESRGLQREGTLRRLCIEIVSDVLLRLGPEVARRWLSELIIDLGSKGFTILAVFDSSMHPVDQANAIINLFDGEINLTQTGVPPDCKKSVLIKKLRNQDYIKNPICLKT